MKKLLTALGVSLGIFFGSFMLAGAVSTFVVQQGGTGVNTFSSGQILYGSGTNPIKTVATTTATCSGTVACSTNPFTIIGSTPVTVVGSGGGGGTFPFTPHTGYNATSTVLGLNGFFTNASSTVNAPFRLSALSKGLAYIGNTGRVGSIATTTVTCSGNTSCTSFVIPGSSPITISSSGGSGTGTVATSSHEVANQIPIFSTTSGTPAKIRGTSGLTFTDSTGILGGMSEVLGTTTPSTIFNVLAGQPTGATDGGNNINIGASDGGATSGAGGNFSAFSGAGVGAGDGGTVQFVAGNGGSTSGSGGEIDFSGGYGEAGNGNGGDIGFFAGHKNGSGTNGVFKFNPATGNNYGILNFNLITSADRTFTFPDASGTLCLTTTCTGGGAYPFTPTTAWGKVTSATTSPLWLKGSPFALFASSTSVFTNASTTEFTISGSAWDTSIKSGVLSTDANGKIVATSTIGANKIGGVLGETHGGTNQSAYTTGDLLYASNTNTLSKRNIGTGGFVLAVSGGVPTWVASTTLANITGGPLSVAKGGTGAATLTGCLTGNGTGAITGSGTCNTSNATVSSVGLSSSGSITVGSTPVTTSGTITANLNMANANTWTALQTFANATTTKLSATYASSTAAYFGKVGIATSTPWKLLSVNGNVAFKGLNTGTGAGALCLTASNEVVYSSGANCIAGGSGTVTAVSVVSTNGFTGSSSGGATPALTLTTSATGLLQGNGTAITGIAGTAGQFPFYNAANTLLATSTVFLLAKTGQVNGNVGISTTTPSWPFNIFSNTKPQLALSNGAGIAQWTVRNAAGNLYFSTTTTNGTATTSIPAFSIGLNGMITTQAQQPATTTAIVLNWKNTPPQVEYRIGTSATKITLINATTSQMWGSRKLVWVCNPGSTAGALTWAGVEWIGSLPTQTTTAKQCDVYSFDVTHATSTSAWKVSGTAGAGFQ